MLLAVGYVLLVLLVLVVGAPAVVGGTAIAVHGTTTAVTGAAHAGQQLSNLYMSVTGKGGNDIKYKVPKARLTGKEGAKDIPSWASGNKPRVGESGRKFAKRLPDEKYGEGNYSVKSQTEFSKIKKWGDRAFEDPK